MRAHPLIALLAVPLLAHADEREDYRAAHTITTPPSDDQALLQRCIAAWGSHPFGEQTPREVRLMTSSVRVMGIGKELTDATPTAWQQLIFVKPAVNVMTKTTLELMNPNGWYCLDANVTVAGKFVIRADCETRLADARSGAAVLGSSDAQGSVAVLGAVRVERVGACAGTAP